MDNLTTAKTVPRGKAIDYEDEDDSVDSKNTEPDREVVHVQRAPVVHPAPLAVTAPEPAVSDTSASTRELEREVSAEVHRCWLTVRLYCLRCCRYGCAWLAGVFVGRWTARGGGPERGVDG